MKEKLFQTRKKLCWTFSTCFANKVSDLQIPKIWDNLSNIKSNHDPVLAVLTRFKITLALLISNKENLSRLSVLKTQMKIKSAKLLKTWMFAKLVKVVTFLQKS